MVNRGGATQWEQIATDLRSKSLLTEPIIKKKKKKWGASVREKLFTFLFGRYVSCNVTYRRSIQLVWRVEMAAWTLFFHLQTTVSFHSNEYNFVFCTRLFCSISHVSQPIDLHCKYGRWSFATLRYGEIDSVSRECFLMFTRLPTMKLQLIGCGKSASKAHIYLSSVEVCVCVCHQFMQFSKFQSENISDCDIGNDKYVRFIIQAEILLDSWSDAND